ncbi:hypothetical protein L288_18465 [Sphingobium quisquiliarum P25]|uniref:Uncharacterized protein n=2 Tax=Sphingobium TaxID=165695 RepID=T0GJK5_9SPHN|nr:hypothetical protein L288_18465 [Sphingobium quisquiliarum P25]
MTTALFGPAMVPVMPARPHAGKPMSAKEKGGPRRTAFSQNPKCLIDQRE